MVILIGLGFVIYSLIGVFGGYLILPEFSRGGGVSGKYIEVKGTGARIAGAGVLLMIFAVFPLCGIGSSDAKKRFRIFFIIANLGGIAFLVGVRYDRWF